MSTFLKLTANSYMSAWSILPTDTDYRDSSIEHIFSLLHQTTKTKSPRAGEGANLRRRIMLRAGDTHEHGTHNCISNFGLLREAAVNNVLRSIISEAIVDAALNGDWT